MDPVQLYLLYLVMALREAKTEEEEEDDDDKQSSGSGKFEELLGRYLVAR